MRILLVEDDPRMRALVARGLAEAGHQVVQADTGPVAVETTGVTGVDVIVLDVMLPGFDGFEVVRRVRAAGCRAPVLMLTARDAKADVVAGLDAGADDYLVKPFSFRELLARLRALERRGPVARDVRLRVGDLALDPASRVVTRGGAAVMLTRTEFNLLECLLAQAGRVVTRHSLIERVWGGEREVEGNTLDAFVKSLRQKVDAGRSVPLIHTVRGVGYVVREGEPQ